MQSRHHSCDTRRLPSFANGAITGAFAYAAETCAEGGCGGGSRTVDPDLLGNDIDITAPNTPQGQALAAKVQLALNDINQASLTPDQVDIIQDVNSIVISDSLTRSYVDEATGTFYLQAGEVSDASVPFLASDIAHDAFHIDEYLEGGIAESRGVQAEVNAFQFQLSVGPALGLSQYEMNYLQGFINNPSSYLPRINQQP
jgi:hypothetical protein